MKYGVDKKGGKRSTIHRWGIFCLNGSPFRSLIRQISKSPCIPRSRKQTRLAKWSSFWSSGINKRGRGRVLLKRSTIFHRPSDQDKTRLDGGWKHAVKEWKGHG
jgi:hypothetical protein